MSGKALEHRIKTKHCPRRARFARGIHSPASPFPAKREVRMSRGGEGGGGRGALQGESAAASGPAARRQGLRHGAGRRQAGARARVGRGRFEPGKKSKREWTRVACGGGGGGEVRRRGLTVGGAGQHTNNKCDILVSLERRVCA